MGFVGMGSSFLIIQIEIELWILHPPISRVGLGADAPKAARPKGEFFDINSDVKHLKRQ